MANLLRPGENFTTPQDFVCLYVLCFPAILLSQEVMGFRKQMFGETVAFVTALKQQQNECSSLDFFLGFRSTVTTKPALMLCGGRPL